MRQKRFHRLFRSLMAMIDGGVERRFFSRAEDAGASQIACRFGEPGTQQFLRVSSIHLASLLQHLAGQTSRHFADAVDLVSRPHEHAGGDQAAVPGNAARVGRVEWGARRFAARGPLNQCRCPDQACPRRASRTNKFPLAEIPPPAFEWLFGANLRRTLSWFLSITAPGELKAPARPARPTKAGGKSRRLLASTMQNVPGIFKPWFLDQF